MTKRIPGFALAVSMMACQAGSAGIGRAAETLKSSERGFFTKSFTGTSAYSAKLPKTSPKTSSPSRSGVFDPGPIFSMTPAKSCPSVSGTRSAPFGLYWCSRTIQSTGLTPAAWIRTSALPRVTLGVSTSSSWTRSGPPNSWMRTAFMGSPPGWDEVVREPLRCERANDLQRAGLFEEMRRAGDNLELLLSPQHRERLAVETKDHVVGSSYDQERRRAHLDEQLSGEVGPSAARNHRRDAIGLACGGHQSRRCARTRPEQADRKSSGLLVGRLGEVLVPESDGAEWLRCRGADHLVRLVLHFRARRRRRNGHCHDDSCRSLLTKRPHRSPHRRAGGEAVVHQDDGATRDGRWRPIAAEQPLAPFELTQFVLRHSLDIVAGDAVCDHIRIEDSDSPAGNCPHGQLLMSPTAAV